jgi:hypothetical protein
VNKNKLGVLKLAQTLGNVSQACKEMGLSRDRFDRFWDLYEQGGEAALQEISRKKAVLKNRVYPVIEKAVCECARAQPSYGRHRVSHERCKQGIFVSGAGVRSIWLRPDLHTFERRLKTFSTKVAQDGLILTEDPLQALERARCEKQAHGEIETARPGDLGRQDTDYVGNLKGVGRMDQQTFIDSDCTVAFVK